MSSPKTIIANTAAALRDLEKQRQKMRAEDLQSSERNARVPGEVWSVRINSGSFHVPWEDTKSLLEEGGMHIVAVRPQTEVNEDHSAQRGEKRRFTTASSGKGEKRSHSAKAVKLAKLTEAPKSDPVRRKALRSRLEESEAADIGGNDTVRHSGAYNEAGPLDCPKKRQ